MPAEKSPTEVLQDAVAPPVPAKAPLWAWSVATVCGIGHLRPGPGTWGSLTAVLLWWSLGRLTPVAAQPWIAAAVALIVTIIGIPAATLVARGAGRKDPQQVVIDEVAGQTIALIGAPLSWKPLLVGFILFRAFDMIKPPPVRQLERLPEGTGIVVDDIGAGIYALIIMQFINWKFGW
jgi:phosphatidylglycerophosphatase A